MVTKQQESPPSVRLPAPRRDGAVSLDSALRARRSVREFTREAVTLAEAGQLLWAAQGITRGGAGPPPPAAGGPPPPGGFPLAPPGRAARAGGGRRPGCGRAGSKMRPP